MNTASTGSQGLLSPTERFTVLRALGVFETDERIRCQDSLAQFFLDDEWREALRFHSMILKRFESRTPGIYFYGLARTHFFDQILKHAIDSQISQILILGSGFDSRAFRFKAGNPINFFEFDRDDVIQKKHVRTVASCMSVGTNNVN